jgi:hypothetical protein
MLRRVFVCASGVRRCSVVSVYNSRSGHGSRPGGRRERLRARESPGCGSRWSGRPVKKLKVIGRAAGRGVEAWTTATAYECTLSNTLRQV